MEQYPPITVADKKLKSTPNLADYAQSYNSFNLSELIKGEIEYFSDGGLNIAYNALERHTKDNLKDKTAYVFVNDQLNEKRFTFGELNALTNKFANLLKSLDVNKGDRVFFFLPRVLELYFGFLGTLKLGAVAGTLFAAFGPQALLDRLGDSGAKVLVTNRELGARLETIKKDLPELKHVLILEDFLESLNQQSDQFEAVHTLESDPAFMLYTSGTTGKPKGVVHVHKAILHEHLTAKWALDLKPDDIYWCTADPGWVTGIAYQIISNLSLGVTSIAYSGRFDPATWYKVIEKFKVTVWYSAPTAIRMLQAAGDELVKFHNLSSLRHLGSVGEPLNPEPLLWAFKTIGQAFHDNWWQTECGGIMIANYPSLDIRPGSMGKPVPGITAAIVDDAGKPVPALTEGNLAIKPGWPSMMKEIWQRPEKYQSYFVADWYLSGDRAYVDNDGYFWFIGRADDVIKTSGERVGPFEVESALVAHPAVAEAGVIGKPDPLRGQIVKAFISLKPGFTPSDQLKTEIQDFVKKELAAHAYPREIEFMASLPKTKSGKIVRRILRAKELGLPIGDTSTLEEY